MQCLIEEMKCYPDVLWHPFSQSNASSGDQQTSCMALGLPNDVLHIITLYTSKRDILSLRLSCKQLQEVASSHVHLLDISLKLIDSKSKLLSLSCSLSCSFFSVRTLVLSNIAKGSHFSSLHDIIQSASGLLSSIQRLDLLDFPVFQLSPMRKLQLIQNWEAYTEAHNRPNKCEVDFLEQNQISWEGCRWLFHPISTLKTLQALEIKLVRAGPKVPTSTIDDLYKLNRRRRRRRRRWRR